MSNLRNKLTKTANTKELQKQFASEVKELAQICHKLNSTWEKLQTNNDYTFDDEIKGYPFEHSFDEVESKVFKWNENIQDFINKED